MASRKLVLKNGELLGSDSSLIFNGEGESSLLSYPSRIIANATDYAAWAAAPTSNEFVYISENISSNANIVLGGVSNLKVECAPNVTITGTGLIAAGSACTNVNLILTVSRGAVASFVDLANITRSKISLKVTMTGATGATGSIVKGSGQYNSISVETLGTSTYYDGYVFDSLDLCNISSSIVYASVVKTFNSCTNITFTGFWDGEPTLLTGDVNI